VFAKHLDERGKDESQAQREIDGIRRIARAAANRVGRGVLRNASEKQFYSNDSSSGPVTGHPALVSEVAKYYANASDVRARRETSVLNERDSVEASLPIASIPE